MATYNNQTVLASIVPPAPTPEASIAGVKPASELTKEEYAARAGVDVSRIIGEPGKFTVAGLPDITVGPEEGIISDTTAARTRIKKTADDIKQGLTDFGIEPPEDTVSPVVDKIIADLQARQTELDKRRTEDIERITKSYEVATEEQKIAQEEAMAKAEGRARIGGFITKMEIDDLQGLARKFRLENIALEGQKQDALITASRAYDDQDFALAQAQLDLARDIEKQTYQKKQDYFKNIIAFNNMNTPLKAANDAMQDFAIDSAIKYPSAFADLEPTDWLEMTPAEVQRRILNSTEFKTGGVEELLSGKEFVADLMTKYPDAGIKRTDTEDQATAKLPKSRIYQQATRLVGDGGVAGVISDDAWVKVIAAGGANVSSIQDENQRNRVVKLLADEIPDPTNKAWVAKLIEEEKVARGDKYSDVTMRAELQELGVPESILDELLPVGIGDKVTKSTGGFLGGLSRFTRRLLGESEESIRFGELDGRFIRGETLTPAEMKEYRELGQKKGVFKKPQQ